MVVVRAHLPIKIGQRQALFLLICFGGNIFRGTELRDAGHCYKRWPRTLCLQHLLHQIQQFAHIKRLGQQIGSMLVVIR